ncbi:MAG: hemolysin family protein [Bacteroidales bacterium]|nr:hemolysin family protein [Bacteroidales bacterium]
MKIIVIIFLILLNGFFSLSEIALVSSRKSRLESYKDKHKKGFRCATKLKENSENFLSSIQVGITLIGIINGFYGGEYLAVYITPLFEWMNVAPHTAYVLASILGIALITFFSIVWGELVPKTIALSNPEKSAVVVAPFVYIFSRIFFPFVKLLSWSTKVTDKMLGIKEPEEHLTEDELRLIIKTASQEGVIEEDENRIHENVFYFADKRARHIMVPRPEIEWIDINQSDDEFLREVLQLHNSKVLVCDDTLDNYIGVLTVKEFLIKKLAKEQFQLRDLLDDPIVCPETTEAQEILNEFRKRQFYFCVVVDEYGSMAGIITLHDLTENIIGEMPEEEEIVEPDVVIRDDGSFLVSGDADIECLPNIIAGMEIDFEEIDYSSVAGLVLENIEHLPQVGTSFECLGYKIEIVDIDHHRIDKVLISKIDKEDDGDGEI